MALIAYLHTTHTFKIFSFVNRMEVFTFPCLLNFLLTTILMFLNFNFLENNPLYTYVYKHMYVNHSMLVCVSIKKVKSTLNVHLLEPPASLYQRT